MQPIAFCTRCRGMQIGWNRRYIAHRLRCKQWVSRSSKLLILTVLFFVLSFQAELPTNALFPTGPGGAEVQQASFLPPGILEVSQPSVGPAFRAIDAFLKRYQVDDSHRGRVAEAIVETARKYDLDARLIASIMIVESRANPFAISNADAIGIMQIHLPTWGREADKEGINLFKIEDNVDFGARILKDYVRRFGLWEGVKRYKGWNPDSRDSLESAEEYAAKVQRTYIFE
jgi:hypothetical protein